MRTKLLSRSAPHARRTGVRAAVVAILGALLIAATPALSATGPLANGGFEEPVVASSSSRLFSTGSSFPGWSVTGAPGNVAPISGAFTAGNLSVPAKAGAQVAGSCTAVGTWVHNTPDIGSTVWTISPGGRATESGIGNATGTATLSGQVLSITFVASDTVTTGVYSWTLGPDCRSGTGTLVFTGPPSRAGATHASTVTKTGGPVTEPPPPRCPAPPRLRTESQTSSCEYRVDFSLRQVREPIQNAARIATRARGFFYIDIDASANRRLPARSCNNDTTFGGHVTHGHVRIDDDDLVLGADMVKVGTTTCLHRRPAVGGAITSFTVATRIKVERSNDRECPTGKQGVLIIRDGAPFDFAVLNLCGHREVFSPSRPGRPQTSAVIARIKVRPD